MLNGLKLRGFQAVRHFLRNFLSKKIGVDGEMFVVYNTNVIRFNIYVTY